MLSIKQAAGEDLGPIVEILQEMDKFYGEEAEEERGVKAIHIATSLFGKNKLAYGLVAYDESGIAGFASYSFLWPASLTTRSLYLKELYVSQSRRRHGVGAALMRHLFTIAHQNDCSRVEWTTDHGNTDAQEFYANQGFAPIESKVFYRADSTMISERSGN